MRARATLSSSRFFARPNLRSRRRAILSISLSSSPSSFSSSASPSSFSSFPSSSSSSKTLGSFPKTRAAVVVVVGAAGSSALSSGCAFRLERRAWGVIVRAGTVVGDGGGGGGRELSSSSSSAAYASLDAAVDEMSSCPAGSAPAFSPANGSSSSGAGAEIAPAGAGAGRAAGPELATSVLLLLLLLRSRRRSFNFSFGGGAGSSLGTEARLSMVMTWRRGLGFLGVWSPGLRLAAPRTYVSIWTWSFSKARVVGA
ncbi:hypothetical protein HDK64DRAFT_270434 [Phyllosticta capitalensis]